MARKNPRLSRHGGRLMRRFPAMVRRAMTPTLSPAAALQPNRITHPASLSPEVA